MLLLRSNQGHKRAALHPGVSGKIRVWEAHSFSLTVTSCHTFASHTSISPIPPPLACLTCTLRLSSGWLNFHHFTSSPHVAAASALFSASPQSADTGLGGSVWSLAACTSMGTSWRSQRPFCLPTRRHSSLPSSLDLYPGSVFLLPAEHRETSWLIAGSVGKLPCALRWAGWHQLTAAMPVVATAGRAFTLHWALTGNYSKIGDCWGSAKCMRWMQS